MNKNFIILNLLVLLMGVSKVWGQTVPWTFTPTTSSQEIVLQKLDSSVHYDGQFSIVGDAIGAFYDQGGTMQCAGYFIIDGINNKFTIYGNDAVDNGYQNFEFFTFYYWHKAQNCVITAPLTFMSEAQYTNGGSDTIYILGAFPAVIEFQKKHYCTKNLAQIPIPLQITNTTLSNVNVSINPPFPGYVVSAGEIQDFGTAEGLYQFTFSTIDNMCIRDATFDLHVGTKLYNTPSITTLDPTCIQPNGTVNLDTSMIDNGTKPFTLLMSSTTTIRNYNSLNGEFNSIIPDEYDLIVTDQELCADTFSIQFNPVPTNCDVVRDILTPQSNNNYQKAYLPWEGLTKIYNSQWQLIHEFTTPSEWDGKDSKGNLVQTGVYFVFTNGKKQLELTVVNEFARY